MMVVGTCRLELRMPHTSSLKEKRQILRSIKDRVRNRFNVSVAEVGYLEEWQRATLAVACVSNEAKVVDEELSNLLLREIKDPRIGFVTITEAEVSDDLRHARVYVVTHETGEERQRTLEGLQSARSYLRAALGRRLRLRYIPELTFCIDETLERGLRIHEILKSLETGEKLDGQGS